MTPHPSATPISPWRPTWPARPSGPTLRGRLGAALGLLAMLALLLIFGRVVSGAVRQGERLRQATAVHADGVWRCNGLRSRGERDRCVDALSAPRQPASPRVQASDGQATSFPR